MSNDGSPDDGELTDSSSVDHRRGSNRSESSPSRSPSPKRDHLDRKQLRTQALVKSTMLTDEDDVMFSMAPRDVARLNAETEKDRSKSKEKEKFKDKESKDKAREQDRERDRYKSRNERKETDRDERKDHRDREKFRHNREREKEKPRSRHEDKSKILPRTRPLSRERERDRTRERDRHRERIDDRKPREKEDRRKHEHRAHKRSPSPAVNDSGKKRERRDSGEKKPVAAVTAPAIEKEQEEPPKHARVEAPILKESPITSPEVEGPSKEEETVITSFMMDSPVGPANSKKSKYCRYDSSPEPDKDQEQGHYSDATPIQSDEEMEPSDHEARMESDQSDDECHSFDPYSVKYEDLSVEQKAMLSPDTKKRLVTDWQKRLISDLPIFYPGIMGCRSVNEFHCVNRVEEGTYGVVFRAKDKRTDEIVALKRLKMEKEKEGFPITSLREINMLLKCGNHPNIVNVKEVLIGSNMDKIYVAMEFVEHDMKSLMEFMSKRKKRWSPGEQKTLLRQLLSGLKHMHDLWILHRDLKTSNLLLSHRGILKIADFGLAREFGSPLKEYTPVVVTLWYRCPELLLGEKLYSTKVDMWSVGCIMAEFLLLKPLFQGKGESDQISKIFLELGSPNEEVWPGYSNLPMVKEAKLPHYPYDQMRKKFPASLLNETGWKLLHEFLRYDPSKRISAEAALNHLWFSEDPKPVAPDELPTFPAKSEQHSAPPPSKKQAAQMIEIVNPQTAKLYADLKVKPSQIKSTGFSLRFDNPKF